MNRILLPLFALLLPSLAQALHVRIPQTSVSVDVPADFILMPASVIASKYARGTPPSTVYSSPGPNWAANIAFALRAQALPPGSLRNVEAGVEKSLEGAPGLRWVKRGVVNVGGREWIALQFWVDGLDAPIYNHLRITREGKGTLLVTANVSQAAFAKYGPELDAAMNGLK